MAETAVNFVLGKLMSLAWDEAETLSGLGREFNVIAKELKSMQAFLVDAEEMAEDHPSANDWVTEVRSIAYRIEDVIDEYTMLQETKHQSSNIISKAARSVCHMPALSRLARSIEDIKADVVDVNGRKERYKKHLAEPGDSSSSGRGAAAAYPSRVSALYAEDSDLVGIDDRKADLIKLLDPDGEYSTCSVIAVVGMGGLGKTTVARRVYKDGAVGSNFPFRAWITVSQSYSPLTLLRDITRQFREAGKTIMRAEPNEAPEDTADIPTLIEKLRNFLIDKRCLAVFDDVWKVELWDYIKSALPDQGNGSKILITTRDEAVAAAWKRSSYSRNNYVYKMQPLSLEEAWSLFCNMAFPGAYNKLCPIELEQLSLEMVSRCEGLPLAIAAIGSLLSTKQKTLLEWQRLHKNLGFHLQNNSRLKDIRRILFLSYHDLPYYLKPCFLYFGMFPEDYSISRGRLVRLWAAEGFLERGRGKLTVEEVAEEYLTELICRNLIQVSEWDITRQRPKAFRVHDLLHELILHKLKELKLCQVSQRACNVDKECRRLSILSSTEDATFYNSHRKLSIRSLFLLMAPERLAKLIVQGSFFKVVHLLKVLIIEGAAVAQIPDEVGDLYLLQYLSIRNTAVTELPKSIGKLTNLQTLDLRHSRIFQLPTEIKKLHSLRYLFAYWQSDGSLHGLHGLQLPTGVLLNFKELQKLSCIDGSQAGGVIHELIYLKQLRKLGITNLKTEDNSVLCKALESMDQLEILFVQSTGESEFFDLQDITSPPPLLRQLFLVGPLKRFPDWFANLSDVVELELVLTGSYLVEDPLKTLQTLPNLAHLGLLGGYIGLGLYVRSTGFKRLKNLYLMNFPEVNTIIIEKGGLPILEKLTLYKLPRLKNVPPGIRDLKNVTGLTLHIPKAIYDESDPIFMLISKVYFLDDWDAS